MGPPLLLPPELNESVTRIRTSGAGARLEGPVLVLRPRVKWLSDECARPEGSPFLAALGEARLEARELAYSSEEADGEVLPLLREGTAPGAFLLATHDAQRKPAVARLALELAGKAPLFHLALGTPRDLEAVPREASVATFGCGWESVAEGVRVLAGLVKPRAKLLT